MDQRPTKDRRRCPRLRCLTEFNLLLLSVSGEVRSVESSEVIDLSTGGLRLRSRQALASGDIALIEMTGRDGHCGVVGLLIVHARDTGDGWREAGARFTAPPAEALRSLLRRRASA